MGAFLSPYAAYQAKAAEEAMAGANAAQARLNAKDAIERGSIEAGLMQTEGTKVIAQQRAAMGASGFDISDPTSLAVAETTRATATLDSEMIKNNALREALGFEFQAAQFDYQRKLAKRSKYTAAASSFLSSIGSMAGDSMPSIGAGGGGSLAASVGTGNAGPD